jgi:hypothetical protein
MQANVTGVGNTGLGFQTLQANLASFNLAIGNSALHNNLTGTNNVAVGRLTMFANTTGVNNVIVGNGALNTNTTGSNNVGLGHQVLTAATGDSNVAIGTNAGGTLTTGSGNIYIDADAAVGAEATTTRIGTAQTACYIQGIYNQTYGATNAPVIVDNTGKLGTIVSTRRAKHNIEDMGDKSADILNLRPVTFAYNHDATETEQYGLIAEEVADVFPAIVMRDEDGTPATVQYHVLPVLLLNEVIKHKAMIEQQNINFNQAIAEINNRLAALERN